MTHDCAHDNAGEHTCNAGGKQSNQMRETDQSLAMNIETSFIPSFSSATAAKLLTVASINRHSVGTSLTAYLFHEMQTAQARNDVSKKESARVRASESLQA
jgi:hypothetical protein